MTELGRTRIQVMGEVIECCTGGIFGLEEAD